MAQRRQVAAAALVLLLAGVAQAVDRTPTEISMNAIVTSLYDIEHPEVDGKWTRCEAIVRRAKDTGAKRIGVVLTISAQGSERRLGFFSYQDGMGGYVLANQDVIGRFKRGLERCFKTAVNSGFSLIRVLPHVDIYEVDANGKQKGLLWRNVVRFDPVYKYGRSPSDPQLSYEDVLVYPAVEALKSALAGSSTSVEFSLAGEQGLSVFSFPKNWAGVMSRVRGSLAGVGGNSHSLGICFNWDKVCGCVEPKERDPLLYNRTYTERLGRWRADTSNTFMGPSVIDIAGTKALLESSDFVGVSGYAPLLRPLSFEALEISWETAAYEFDLFGISIKDLMARGKRLIYSEHGLGGCYWDFTVAPDIKFVKEHPWLGHWPNNGYDPATNPWLRTDYQQFRRDYYDTVIRWAKAGGGPQYKIDGIYTWSVGSFDIAGVHPVSSNAKGSYADPAILAALRDANAQVNSGDVREPTAMPAASAAAPPTPAPVPPAGGAAPQPQPQISGGGDGFALPPDDAPEAWETSLATERAAAAARGGAGGPSIMQALNDYNFKLFAKMAETAGVGQTLSAPGVAATVLAPTDDAIRALAADFETTPEVIVTRLPLADHLVGSHVLLDQKGLRAADLRAGMALQPVRRRGGRIAVGQAPGGPRAGTWSRPGEGPVTFQTGQTVATLAQAEIPAGPATILPIDRVLLPNDVFKNLRDALKANPSTQALSGLAARDAALTRGLSSPKTIWTVFAPDDKALQPEVSGISMQDPSALNKILWYHATPGLQPVPGVRDSNNVKTGLAGHAITIVKVKPDGGAPYTQVLSEDGKPATVQRANIVAGAGLMHVIDGVLIPKLDKPPATADARKN